MLRFHRSALLFGVGFMTVGLLLAGCAKPPTEEINAAQATIDSVKALPDVQTYGMDQVRAAETALAAVRQQVTEKKYKEAREALPNVVSTARGAVTAAAGAKEAARVAAEQAIADARAAIQEAEGKIPQAPKTGKGAIRDIRALRADVDSAKVDLAAAEAANGTMDYATASAKARDAVSKAHAVTQTVNDALAMRARR